MTIRYILCDGLVTGLMDPSGRKAFRAAIFTPVASRAASGPDVLDAIPQISLLVKLKLTNCAPMSGLSEIGFFMSAPTCLGEPTSAARKQGRFLLLLTSDPDWGALECTPSVRQGSKGRCAAAASCCRCNRLCFVSRRRSAAQRGEGLDETRSSLSERPENRGIVNTPGNALRWLDAPVQIRLFVKLKLTNCAPISGLPEIGFFMGASRVNPTCDAGNPGLFCARRLCLLAQGRGIRGLNGPVGCLVFSLRPCSPEPHGWAGSRRFWAILTHRNSVPSGCRCGWFRAAIRPLGAARANR
jgi:hypothetical protein